MIVRTVPMETAPKPHVLAKFEPDTPYQRALWALNTYHETEYVPATRREIKCQTITK